jgi:hypothetical protein
MEVRMSDSKPKPPAGGVTGQFILHLGTPEEPRNLSDALRELRRHLDRAKIRNWVYADPIWADEERSTVIVIFPDARAAAAAARNW